jgi:zinc protease
MNKKGLCLVLFFLFNASFAHAIEVVFEEDASLPLVYINVVIQGGSVDDPVGQEGLSHFMAEMLLRGSKSRTKEQIDLELDHLGARLEVETRAEALILRGAVLSSQLDAYLKTVLEIITQPIFPANEIRKLKSEVTSHILEELGKDSSLASRRATKFFFQGHPYGNPVIGLVKEVERCTQNAVVAHYDRMFRDKKMLIIGTGNVNPEKIRKWGDNLAHLRAGGKDPVQVSPPHDALERRMMIVDKPERTQTQIHVGQIGVQMTDSDFFPLYLANHAFGGGSFSARMMVEIRVKRGWSYGAYSYFRHGRQPRSWQLHLFPATKDTASALAFTLNMVNELKEKGLTPEEFNFSKQSLINSAGFMFNTPQKRVENKVLERTLHLPDGFMKSYGSQLEKVTLAETNQALKHFLKPNHLSILVLGSAKDLLEDLSKQTGLSTRQIKVVPYTQE